APSAALAEESERLEDGQQRGQDPPTQGTPRGFASQPAAPSPSQGQAPGDIPAAPFLVPLDTWVGAAPCRRSDVQVHSDLLCHPFLDEGEDQARALAGLYGSWVAQVEAAILQREGCDKASRAARQGRARGFGATWRQTAASPGRAHLHHLEADAWATHSANLAAIIALAASGKDHRQLLWRLDLHRSALADIGKLSAAKRAGQLADYQRRATVILDQPRQEQAAARQLALDLAGDAARRALQHGRQAFATWAAKATLGQLHRWTKDGDLERLEDPTEGGTLADPVEVMLAKSTTWQKVWTAPADRTKAMPVALASLRVLAAQETIEPIAVDGLNAATGKLGPRKAQGVDRLSPLDVERLPDCAKEQFLAVLHQAEAHCMWPPQLNGTLGAVGDRVLGLLPMPDHWDTAIKGSSALRAALYRATLDETAQGMGIHHASLYADIAKFFDSLDLAWLIERAVDLGFSPTVLALEVEAFLAPRYLKRGQWVGPPIFASQSIVSGSTNGARFGKIFLCPILQAAQAKAQATTIWSYIDDTVWRAEGTNAVVTHSLAVASAALAQQCSDSRLAISRKTTPVASSAALRKGIGRRMRQHGVPGHGAHHMVDLGVDVVTGNRRSQRKAHTRHTRAALRARRVQRLRRAAARLGKLGASLHATGVQPQAVFGREVWGIAPSRLALLRRSAAAAAAGTGPGRCLDTAMALLYGDKDPVIKLRTQLVHEWLTQWLARPELHKRVLRIWPHVHHRLLRAKTGRWRKVHGPVAAVIATLMGAGWRPTSPRSWSRPTAQGDEEWTIPLADHHGQLQVDFQEFSELVDFLAVDLDRLRWQRASQHAHGAGLGRAGDVSQVKRELDHCDKHGRWQEWALDYLVAAGGQWPRQRQIAAGFQGDAVCQRCLSEAETPEHRMWRCPCNQGKPAYDQTAHLIPQALSGLEECPALWLRGVSPASHTTPPVPTCDDELLVHFGAPWPAGGSQPTTVFGDASGGKHGADERRRRVGVGVAVIEACASRPGEGPCSRRGPSGPGGSPGGPGGGSGSPGGGPRDGVTPGVAQAGGGDTWCRHIPVAGRGGSSGPGGGPRGRRGPPPSPDGPGAGRLPLGQAGRGALGGPERALGGAGKACGPRWQLAAGAIATLPGRRQTVPRGEIFAFVLALEQLETDIHYVTDNMPLLNGWNAQRWLHLGKGANSDLWARIGRSLLAHPDRQVGVTWTPSHQEDEGEPMISHFLAAGNCCADRLASLGAEAAAASASRSTPHADRWDVIASQVRRRARRALLDAAGGDPWLSERPAAEQVARPSALQRAIDDSPHQLVTLGQGKWKCLLCRQNFPAATLREAAASACAAAEADWASFDHVREVLAGMQIAMGAGVVHASHRLYEWPAHSPFFCGDCGAHGTTMGMGLRGVCTGETTRKTDEALRRIAKGVYPSHQGPPKPVIEAKAISATIAHVVGSGLAPADPAIPENLPDAGR
ncbi:unnamed protein product, partial [Prorocentrum cordatum]